MTDKKSLSIEVGRILLPVIILAMGVGGFFALGSRPKLPLEEAAESPAPAVEVVPVAIHEGVLNIDVDGVVVPYREVSLAAEVSGRISMKADVCRAGNYVTKGTTLLEIDPRDYELKVRQLTKQLNQADVELKELDVESDNTKSLIELAEDTLKLRQNEHKRFADLAKKDYATDSQLEEQQQNVLTARNALLKLNNQLRTLATRRIRLENAQEFMAVQLEKAQLDLSRAKIVAPIDGVVISDPVELDSYVNVGSSLVDIEDTSAVEVKCNLRMKELYWLWNQPDAQHGASAETEARTGYQIPKTPVEVTYRMGGREYCWDGILSRFDGIGLDSQTRTVPCRVVVKSPRAVRVKDVDGARRVPTGPPALVRGMYVSVLVHTNPQDVLFDVPEQAVRPGDRLWRVRGGKLAVLKVQVVGVSADVATVQAKPEALGVGDKVVVSPLAFVEDGMAVREQAAR